MPCEPFRYHLPAERIAQRPVVPYDRAKLLVLRRENGELFETCFTDLVPLLSAADLLVFNNTRVIPARLFGEIAGRKGEVEVFLLSEEKPDLWLCLGRPLKKFDCGVNVLFKDGLTATVLEKTGKAQLRLAFSSCGPKNIRSLIFAQGRMPIPPYIRGGKSDESDRLDYQTMFAAIDGSIACPTAGLHFTPALVSAVQRHGCCMEYVTLHVGESSIRPLWRDGQEEAGAEYEQIGSEKYLWDGTLLDRCREIKRQNGRVIAVGTTVVRALESMVREKHGAKCWVETDLCISPGYEFQVVDAMVTNFHQPGTSHLLMVEAFIGSRRILADCYQYALEHDFRFLSYGDGMMIV
mgnify:CR=1 FL=1